MLKAKKPVKVSHKEIREDQLVTAYTRFMGWYYKNEKPVLFGGIAVAVVLAATIGWTVLKANQNEEAGMLLASVFPSVSSNQWEAALKGDTTATKPGLAEIADSYSGTGNGAVAAFYAGKANLELGNYEEAKRYFEMVSSKDEHLDAAALSGIAAFYENEKNYEKAAGLYESAAAKAENKLLTPRYLYLAALNHAEAGDKEEAVDLLKEVKELYKDSAYARDADKYIALFGGTTEN